ncbi:MAG TPA: hypothetical protein VK077_08510, partial [Virgibacillus sp.]|nr:hypothetical protein [Virgibacillus sp.]
GNRATNHEFMEEGSYAIGSLKDYIGQFTVDASIAEKHWLIEHNIQPVFAGEFIPTIHHYWGDQVIEQKEWEAKNRTVDHSGLFSLYMYFDGLFYLIPLILFLFLLGGGFASERGKKPTIQMLKTQPLTERHIFTGKIINAGWITLISTGAITSLIILIGTVFNRLGDWMYPILHYDPKVVAQSDDYAGTLSDHFGFHFIPIGEYLLKSIGLLLLVGLFLTVFMIVMSLFFNYELSVFGSAGVIVAVGYLVSRYVLTESAHLSPFTYLHIPKIVNGEIATVLNNPTINFQTGIIVLSITTFILFMIGYVLLSKSLKKDF